jgi:plastocyanin
MRLSHAIFFSACVVLGACGGGGGDSANGTPTSPSTPTTPSSPSTPSAPVATDQVEVGNDLFSPANITVPVNTTVRWTWSADATTHNVTGSGGLASGDMTAGDTYTKVFTAPGTFNYQCTIHGGMSGSVVVTQ